MPAFTSEDIKQVRLMVRESQHEDDVIASLNILGDLNVVEAVPDMMRHLSDKRSVVRSALESALLKFGQPAIPAIVEYLPKLNPEEHIHLQEIVASFWKEVDTKQIQHLMNHEDNRVRWAMAWTLAKPLKTMPPEDIGYVFEGLADEPLTAIRWAATQSLLALAHTSDNIPSELIKVALPVMVDNFKYGDVNLSETSVGAIALLIDPPHPAVITMIESDSADFQVTAVKILTAWVADGKTIDEGTLQSLTQALPRASWLMTNEVSRLRYVLSISHPEALGILDGVPEPLDDVTLATKQDIRATGEIMLPPLADDS